MTRITDYTALTTPAAGDVLPIVDIDDTTMSAAGTTKKITVADLGGGIGGWVNVADLGADPTGASSSYAVVQAAIDAVAYVASYDSMSILGAAQTTIYFPPDPGATGSDEGDSATYLIDTVLVIPQHVSIRLTGGGDGVVLKSPSNSIIDFDGVAGGLTEGSIEIDHLGFDATGGHIFQNANLSGFLSIHDVALTQRSTGYCVFYTDDYANGGTNSNFYSAVFRNIRYLVAPGTRSIAPWHMVSSNSDAWTDITFEHISGPLPTGYTGHDTTNDTTQPQFYLTCTDGTTGHMTNVTFRDINAASPFGGIIKACAQRNLRIEGVAAYNTYDGAMTNPLIYCGPDPVGGGICEGVTIRDCVRVDQLGSAGTYQPPYDIQLDSSCNNVRIDNYVVSHPSDGSAYIDVGTATGVVIIQPGTGEAGASPQITNQNGDTIVIGLGEITIGGSAIGAPNYDVLVAGLAPDAWWKLADAVSSTTAADSSGNGWTATVASGWTFGEPGPIVGNANDTAASSNGNTDMTTSFSPSGLSEFTILAWVNMLGHTPSNGGSILANDNPASTNNGFYLQLNYQFSAWYPQLIVGNGSTHVNAESGGGTSSDPLATTGWQFIAAVVSLGASQAVKMYVNGANTGNSGTMSGTVAAGSAGVALGYNTVIPQHHFDGELAQVAFIPSALTAGQVADLYEAGLATIVTSVTAGDTSVVIGGTPAAVTLETATLDVIATDHPPAAAWSNNAYKITDIANGSASSDAAAYGQILPLAGGTMTGFLAPAVVTLAFGSSIAVSAAAGNDFRLTLTASTGTIAAPSGPVDGQAVEFQITQGTGGSFTVAWASGTGGFDFGTAGAPTLSTSAGKTDIISFRYNAAKSAWLCTGSALGF